MARFTWRWRKCCGCPNSTLLSRWYGVGSVDARRPKSAWSARSPAVCLPFECRCVGGSSPLFHSTDGPACAVALQQRCEDHAATACFDELLSIDGLAFPILTFDQDIWAHRADGFFRAGVIKDHHVADTLKRGQDAGAVAGRIDRAILALEGFHGAVAVEAYDQAIRLCAREIQNLDMAGVQQVETPISE